ncbi:MAG: hypothetical protein VYE68_04385 [Acidobacteriota bacterium]|nr:hypothetical protein [Acidobacteriota bacterium]
MGRHVDNDVPVSAATVLPRDVLTLVTRDIELDVQAGAGGGIRPYENDETLAANVEETTRKLHGRPKSLQAMVDICQAHGLGFAPETIAETRPDYVLILPWNLKDEIAAQLHYVRNGSGQLVVPIPGTGESVTGVGVRARLPGHGRNADQPVSTR